MRTIYTLIIPDPGRRRVLLVPRDQQWALPELTFEERYFWQVVGQINAAVRERFNLEATTLRCRSILPAAEGRHRQFVYELELHGPSESLAVEGRWAGPDAVDELPPAHRPLVVEWWDEAGRPRPATSRAPWYRPGWRDAMLSWLQATLEQAGRTLTGPVEQIRSWERSALWRAPTDLGLVYFKAVPPVFGHELALTAWLADRFPALIPAVLALDPARGWLLMADAGRQPLIDHREIGRWEAALRDYAQMQVELSRRVDELVAVGVPDRGLTWLRAGLERLLADLSASAEGTAGLTPPEIVALRALEPDLLAACTTMEQSGLPVSLEHGDFSAWQVQIDGDNHRFLDWSDSSVAPPFFSMLGVLRAIEAAFPAVPDAASRLRDAYLAPWTEAAQPHIVREAFDAAQRLAPLHHALIYYVDILPSLEHQWEMEQMVPYYLRMLLM